MRVGSLFSGIGGLELGLERAGMQVVWQVECDPYARRVLEKHWPNVERYEDVQTVHGWELCCPERKHWCLAGCLQPVDLICGGFPCQDISVAGKGKGIQGERSGLWKEFARIIGEVKPSWVLIENSPALVGRGLNTVLRDLADLGFNAEWQVIPAAAFGAGHLRKRIFVVAYSNRDRLTPIFPSKRSVESAHHEEWESEKTSSGWPHFEFVTGKPSRWTVEPDVGRVAHGVPHRVDRLRCLGNAVVPQVAEHVGRLILAAA